MEFNLNRDGFVTKYLVSGKKDLIFHDDHRDTNQLRYEKYLRSLVAVQPESTAADDTVAVDSFSKNEVWDLIRIGENSQIGMPWRYYVSEGNVFVDDSDFYLDPRFVELMAATNLVADEEMEVSVNLWSYGAVCVWVNGKEAARIDRPRYKPISRVNAAFHLEKGENHILVKLCTLGVRDTNVSFALQIMEKRRDIRVVLPDEESAMPLIRAEKLLEQGSIDGSRLRFPDLLPEGSLLRYRTGNIDFRKKEVVTCDIGGKKDILLKEYPAFSVYIPMDGMTLQRSFERIELCTAQFLDAPKEGNEKRIMEKIAEVASITRGEEDGFALYPMLARYYLEQRKKEDRDEILVTLKQIDRRMDCADFMTCGLVRLMKLYELDQELKEEIKKTMLNFRYWMDEDGFDGMCFWSENHTLMFYETAYFFGEEYPDDVFKRSGKTGKELRCGARERILEWLSDVVSQGFDEFNSGTYTAITFAALLNLIDFAEKEIADKAWTAADLIMRTIARHTFQNVIISPQGRIYRDVLYPHRQHLQALLQYVVPEAPYVYNEWLSALAGTRYRMPEDLQEIMEQKGWQSYKTSNAVVDLYKTEEYILTSVESPRRDGISRVWEHRMEEQEREHFHYVKSMNECFHGTMQFEPGVFGYQQHMWYAALGQDLVVFSNHPGQYCETKGESRPGYWFGNGIMPAMRQKDHVLGILYQIPDTHPIHFVHLFWNEKGFDETLSDGLWLFGRRKESYIGIWCSQELTDYDEVLSGCEKRAYGGRTAFVCICGGKSQDGDFAAFMGKCRERKIFLDEEKGILDCQEFSLHFEAASNPTQYVE